MKNTMKRIVTFFKSERGQGMVEYGLIIALVAIVVIAALVILGPKIADLFTGVSDKMVLPGGAASTAASTAASSAA